MQTPSKQRNTPTYKTKMDKSYNSIVVMVVMFFVGFGWCVSYYPYTLISIFSFSKFLVFFGVVGFLIPLKYYAQWFHFAKYETILLNIMGFAPFFTGLMLFLNFSVSTNHFKHYYSAQIYYGNNAEQLDVVGFDVEKNFFSGKYKVTKINFPTEHEFANRNLVETTIFEGILGFQVVKDELKAYYN